MKKDKMEKCKSCINFDAKKSNKNWTVCKCIPLEVIVSGTSKDCIKYEAKQIISECDGYFDHI